ncbi:hypothetical protein ARMSODRAFT_1026651 [Armillaria solidipes]|uniref:Uncharacterized protein n=1 Tax=Armillaria solidipes TaxID=1076256 RepID=A0A2H3B8U4_9AGAR|nr:hypothetical protein ARMSODRAFT_1026651 [Armillaria solidipes]
MLRCDGKLFLALGEVISITVGAESFEQIMLDIIGDESVIISYQLIYLTPMLADGSPDQMYDWKSICQLNTPQFKIPGCLLQVINPSVSVTDDNRRQPYYQFESSVLMSLSADMLLQLVPQDVKHIPKVSVTKDFPYHNAGKACFICECDDSGFQDNNIEEWEYNNRNTCSLCPVVLDCDKPQSILTHIATHILHDTHVDQSSEPCGLCLLPSPICCFMLKGALWELQPAEQQLMEQAWDTHNVIPKTWPLKKKKNHIPLVISDAHSLKMAFRTTHLRTNASSEDTSNEMRTIPDLEDDDAKDSCNLEDIDASENDSNKWQDNYNPDLWEINADVLLEK